MERTRPLTEEEMTRYPLTSAERTQLKKTELDPRTALGRALLGEVWLNFDKDGQDYWIYRLRTGVIQCNTYLCPSRRQVEVEIELHPGEFAYFCVTLSNMDRFL